MNKANNFQVGDTVLKWDSRREDKGINGKFENLWKGPYIIHSIRGHNAFFLQGLNGEELFGGPVNGRMLKHYFCQESKFQSFHSLYKTLHEKIFKIEHTKTMK